METNTMNYTPKLETPLPKTPHVYLCLCISLSARYESKKRRKRASNRRRLRCLWKSPFLPLPRWWGRDRRSSSLGELGRAGEWALTRVTTFSSQSWLLSDFANCVTVLGVGNGVYRVRGRRHNSSSASQLFKWLGFLGIYVVGPVRDKTLNHGHWLISSRKVITRDERTRTSQICVFQKKY